MEEPTFLPTVQRDVGAPDQARSRGAHFMRLEEQIDQQRIDLRPVAIDLVILRCMPPRRVLEAIERLLPANGSQSVRSTGLNLPASTTNVGSLRISS